LIRLFHVTSDCVDADAYPGILYVLCLMFSSPLPLTSPDIGYKRILESGVDTFVSLVIERTQAEYMHEAKDYLSDLLERSSSSGSDVLSPGIDATSPASTQGPHLLSPNTANSQLDVSAPGSTPVLRTSQSAAGATVPVPSSATLAGSSLSPSSQNQRQHLHLHRHRKELFFLTFGIKDQQPAADTDAFRAFCERLTRMIVLEGKHTCVCE